MSVVVRQPLFFCYYEETSYFCGMIETARMILRSWSEDDAEALYRYASDTRVSEPAMWPCHESIEMSRKVIRDYFMPNPEVYAMVLKESGTPVKCVGLVPTGSEYYPTAEREREVGYWIGYPYWGKGLTTEAVTALIQHYRAHPGVDSLLLTTMLDNDASQRVAAKCGFGPIADFEYEGIPCRAFRRIL